MKKYDVVALGEALIDYIPQDGKVCGQYRASVGGAPLNVSIGIAKLSGNTALIARVGDDPLGYTIIRTLQEKKVNTSLIQIDRSRNTPVTIVFPDSSDMQRYIIYRKDGSDSALVLDEISGEVLARPMSCIQGLYYLLQKNRQKRYVRLLERRKNTM